MNGAQWVTSECTSTACWSQWSGLARVKVQYQMLQYQMVPNLPFLSIFKEIKPQFTHPFVHINYVNLFPWFFVPQYTFFLEVIIICIILF